MNIESILEGLGAKQRSTDILSVGQAGVSPVVSLTAAGVDACATL